MQGSKLAARSRSFVLGDYVAEGAGRARLTGPFPTLDQPPMPRRINVAHIRKFGVAVPD